MARVFFETKALPHKEASDLFRAAVRFVPKLRYSLLGEAPQVFSANPPGRKFVPAEGFNILRHQNARDFSNPATLKKFCVHLKALVKKSPGFEPKITNERPIELGYELPNRSAAITILAESEGWCIVGFADDANAEALRKKGFTVEIG